jgi:phosphoglycolate phosphatase
MKGIERSPASLSSTDLDSPLAWHLPCCYSSLRISPIGKRYEGLVVLMDFKAVLFDLDGTLLDTLGDLANSMNGVLKRRGFPQHERELYKQFVGDGMEALVRRALPESHQGEQLVEACSLAMREEYSVRWRETTRPYAGIPELLDALARSRCRMAILSNKPDDFTREMVGALLASWRFDAVVGARPEVPKKPDPTMALAMARDLAIPPARIIYLGDSGTDMRTAVSAGMFPIGALWGFRGAAELEANGARVLISRPTDLLGLL